MTTTEAQAAIIFGDGIVHGAYWAGSLLVRSDKEDPGVWVPTLQNGDKTIGTYNDTGDLVDAAALRFPLDEWEEEV